MICNFHLQPTPALLIRQYSINNDSAFNLKVIELQQEACGDGCFARHLSNRCPILFCAFQTQLYWTRSKQLGASSLHP